MTDPVSGQTVCSCQYDSARLALSGYSRIPTGGVGVYGAPYPSTDQNPYPSIGVDSSAFYSPLVSLFYNYLISWENNVEHNILKFILHRRILLFQIFTTIICLYLSLFHQEFFFLLFSHFSSYFSFSCSQNAFLLYNSFIFHPVLTHFYFFLLNIIPRFWLFCIHSAYNMSSELPNNNNNNIKHKNMYI